MWKYRAFAAIYLFGIPTSCRWLYRPSSQLSFIYMLKITYFWFCRRANCVSWTYFRATSFWAGILIRRIVHCFSLFQRYVALAITYIRIFFIKFVSGLVFLHVYILLLILFCCFSFISVIQRYCLLLYSYIIIIICLDHILGSISIAYIILCTGLFSLH